MQQFDNRRKALAAALLAAAAPALAEQTVRIGHVAPISGPIAYFGKDNENGARLAIEALNARGVRLGGRTVRFELLAEDDGGDPKQATAAAQKLVDAGVAGVVGHMNSGTTIPASKVYNDAGIAQISPSATNPKYTRQGFNTAFRVVANDIQLGSALGRYAVQQGAARRIAVIDDRTAYGQGVAEEFVKGARASLPAVAMVAREFTSDKATDFTAILTRIKAGQPDLIFFGGMSAVAGPMLRQMKQLGMAVKFLGGDGICSDELGKLAGDGMADGQVVCAEAGGVAPSQQGALDQFKVAYRKRFGKDIQIYAPYVYDAVLTLAAAMEQAGSADPAKYLPVLAAIHRPGITGMISFDARGDIRNGSLTLYGYKAGKRLRLAVTN